MKLKYIEIFIFILLTCINISFAMYPIDCFSYYKFQDGVIFDSFNPEKISYSAGEDVIFSYNLISRMESPITEGRTRVQIFYNDEEEGEIIIDEFFLDEKVSINLGDVIPKEFKWKIPKNAKSGEYTSKIYFIVGKFFNLAGLSFLAYGPPGAPGALTTFRVNNTEGISRIYFSKKNTYFNGEKYNFGSFFPEIRSDESIKIETELVNEGEMKSINLEINIYEWDDVTENPMGEYTKKETITLGRGERKRIKFEIPRLRPGAYQVKFVAASGDEKSILKVRFSVIGEMGRFIFLGIDRFPIRSKENTTLFICLSNSADYFTNFNGTIKLYVYDKDGRVIFRDESREEILPRPMGFASNFISDKDYKYITIIGEIYGSDGRLHDREIITYDYSSFPFIPRFLYIETNKESYLANEEIEYKISYTDEENYPLSGLITIELVDSEEKTLSAYRTRIEGIYENSIKISTPGIYKIVAFDAENNLKYEKSIKVLEEKIRSKEEKTLDFSMILILVIVVGLCIILIYKFILRRGRKYEAI